MDKQPKTWRPKARWAMLNEEHEAEYFTSERAALDAAERAIDSCRDEEWAEGVENICVVRITHMAERANVVRKDMLDEEGEYRGQHYGFQHDYHCDYKMQPVEEQRCPI